MIDDILTNTSPFSLYDVRSYYHRHGEFVKATVLMSGMARSEEDVEIGTRIAHLHKAVASAERAVACSASAAECQHMTETLVDLKDTLDIAGGCYRNGLGAISSLFSWPLFYFCFYLK